MKKQRSYVGIVVILIVIAAAAGLITTLIGRRMPSKERADHREWFSLAGSEDIGLTVDGLVSSVPLKRINGEVYVPVSVAADSLGARIYYDENAGLLTVTAPTACRNFAVSDLAAGGEALEDESGLYLALSFVSEWTDMAVTTGTAGENVPYIAVRRTFPYEEAGVIEDTVIRTRPSIKAPILEDVPAGSTVELVVTDDTAEGWTAAAAKDGIGGYIQSESLGDTYPAGTEHVSVLGEYTAMTLGEKVNLAFYPTNNAINNAAMVESLRGARGVNVVAPTWFFLEGPGEVTSVCDSATVEACHDMGVQVWALINDIDGNVRSSEAVAAVLGSTPSRQAIVRTIVDTALSAGVDGLNADIEHVSKEGVGAYLTFIRELSAECRAKGLFFSVDTTVPMPYSRYLNRREMGILADYVIVMCYDEHFNGSEEAGSVSSLPFVENGIADTKELVPAEKIVAGIPFYTRLWASRDSGAPSSELMSMASALQYVSERGMTVFWDENVSQHVAEETIDGTYYQIWLEDAESIAAKMDVIRSSGIAGVAEWRLGNETPEIWEIIETALAG